MNLKKAFVASVAALSLLAATLPADAQYRHYGGGGYRGGGWHRGGYGVGLGILGLGLAAGAIAAGGYYGPYGYGGCYRYRPIYDYYGNYIGRRLVNVCY